MVFYRFFENHTKDRTELYRFQVETLLDIADKLPYCQRYCQIVSDMILLYTECQSSFIPVSYWLRTYHVIVEKFYCLSGNVAKRWTLLLFTGK